MNEQPKLAVLIDAENVSNKYVKLIMDEVSNYGVALVLFTLIVKLLLFPLGLKQQKSTVKMQIIQPKIQEIQAKYKNNQAKMNEELQALYAKENYNPMSGCGTLLIQFPVIFGLLDVVYKPLTHLLRFSKETITALTEVAGTLGIATTGYAPQINIYPVSYTHLTLGDVYKRQESRRLFQRRRRCHRQDPVP